MSRSVPPWVGKDHDTAVPPHVRVRVFDAKAGRCHRCTRRVMTGEPWICEHIVALINGGANSETNLGVTCKNCLPEKNADDLAEKSVVYETRAKFLGVQMRRKRRW